MQSEPGGSAVFHRVTGSRRHRKGHSTELTKGSGKQTDGCCNVYVSVALIVWVSSVWRAGDKPEAIVSQGIQMRH